MEVKPVGEKPIDKKKWVILFSAIGVVIVGLAVAIIVVLATRNNTSSNNNGGGNTNNNSSNNAGQDTAPSKEELALYDEGMNEVMSNSVLTGNASIGDVVAMIKEKMDAETNEKVKALYAIDYYMYYSGLDANKEKKDEILNGLIEADKIVQSTNSAATIITVASFYEDQDLVDRYSSIMEERITQREAEDAEKIEKGEFEESGNEDENGGVGAYSATKVA